jgi:hypothetical protein
VNPAAGFGHLEESRCRIIDPHDQGCRLPALLEAALARLTRHRAGCCSAWNLDPVSRGIGVQFWVWRSLGAVDQAAGRILALRR